MLGSNVRITTVKSVPGKHVLEIGWSNGERSTVDLTNHINAFPALKALESLLLFSQVELGDWGFGVTWDHCVEVSAATLHRLALA
jgi:hypothetical protein